MLTYKYLYLLPQIINWRVCLKFPEEPKISDEARDLICRLLCDVESRLGTRGAEEIKVRLVKRICKYALRFPCFSALRSLKFVFVIVSDSSVVQWHPMGQTV